MSEGTSVGSIYIDLVVRNKVDKQVQEMASKAQTTTQKAFLGAEKTAEKSVSNITSHMGKLVGKAMKLCDTLANGPARAVEKMISSTNKFSTSVEKTFSSLSKLGDTIANGPARAVENALQSVNQQTKTAAQGTEAVFRSMSHQAKAAGESIAESFDGVLDESIEATKSWAKVLESRLAQVTAYRKEALLAGNDELTEQLSAQQTKLYDRLAAARERLAALEQHAGETGGTGGQGSVWQRLVDLAKNFGNAATEAFSKANGSAVSFGNVASEAFSKAGGLAGLLGGKVGMIATVIQTVANVISKAVDKVKDTFSKVKTVISKIGNAVSKLSGKFGAANKSAGRFGSRLREIATGALFFNGISAALRNMVSYMSKAVSSSDEMKQALANLKGAAANAASPIIQILTPALTQLTNAAATALTYVSRLVETLTGKVSNAAATAAKSADKAAGVAKRASKSLAGFDQIDRLGGDSGSSGGDSGNDTIEPNYDFKGFSPFLESIMAEIEAGEWMKIGEKIAEKLNGILSIVKWDEIQSKIEIWTQNLVGTLNGFVHKVDWDLIGSGIGNGLNTVTTTITSFFEGFNWVELGNKFASGLDNLLVTIDWEKFGKALTEGFRATFEWLHGFVEDFSSSGGFTKLGTKIAEMLKAALGNINWEQLAGDVYTGIIGLLDTAIAFVQEVNWDEVRQTISDCFDRINWGEIGKKIGELLCSIEWGAILESVWEIISEVWKAKWETLGSILWECIKKIGKSVVKHFKEVGLDGIQGFLEGIRNPISTIASWLNKHLVQPLIDAVCDLLGIHSPSKVFAEIGVNLIDGLLNGISETWDSITEFFGDVFADLKDAFSQTWDTISDTVSDVVDGIQTKVSDVFTDVKDTVSSIFNSVKDTVTGIWNDIESTIKDAVNGIIGFINGMVSGIVDGLNAAIRALNKLSVKVPDWEVFGDMRGDTFGFNLQTITAPQIPYLADGGIIQQPTLAMVGEYPGARNDPEIVTPQSLMEETVAGTMEDLIRTMMTGFESLLEEQRLTRQVVESIEVGDDTIGRAAARYSRRVSRAGGF